MNTNSGGRGDVVVIGSGCAGMGAAYRMHRAGFKVRVLEANDYIGGRTRSLKKNGFLIDQGATIVWTNYTSILGIIREDGLGDMVTPGGSMLAIPLDAERVYNLDSDHILRDAARFPLTNRSRLKAMNLLFDAFRLRGKLKYEDLSGVTKFDIETATEYGRRRLNEELVETLVRPLVRGLIGAPAGSVSNIDLLFSVVRFMGIACKILAYRDGIGSYPHQISRHFDVTLNARVSAVEEVGDRVRVSWSEPQGERTQDFAGCIIAVPGVAAAPIHLGLDPWRRQFLDQMRYTKILSVALALSKPPKNMPATWFCTPEHMDVFCSIFEHNKSLTRVPPGKGLVNLYTNDKLSQELMDEPDDIVVKRVIKSANDFLPRIGDDVEFGEVRRWPTAILHSRVGHYKDLVKFRELRIANDKRIQFAGDYFAPSTQNSASASGEQAAGLLISKLGN